VHWNICRNASVPGRSHPATAASRGLGQKISRFAKSEELRRGVDFYQIAKTHNRSIGSIVARLVKLGKMGPNAPLDMFDPNVA
jgi:hypothetical protein